MSEEEHADWLETQLAAMRQIGDANYLAQHFHSWRRCPKAHFHEAVFTGGTAEHDTWSSRLLGQT